MFVSALVTAAVLLSTSPNSSGLPRQPSGKWIVNFDDAQCVAERNYGTEDKPLYFVLKQPPLGSVIQLSLIDDQSGGSATELSGTLQFDSQPSERVRILRFKPKEMKLRVLQMNLPLEQFYSARTAAH